MHGRKGIFDMNWSIADFVLAGAILLTAGALFWLIVKKTRSNMNRIVFVSILVLVIALVWAELAVGLFNSPFAGS
jgi:hypothetical protein